MIIMIIINIRTRINFMRNKYSLIFLLFQYKQTINLESNQITNFCSDCHSHRVNFRVILSIFFVTNFFEQIPFVFINSNYNINCSQLTT